MKVFDELHSGFVYFGWVDHGKGEKIAHEYEKLIVRCVGFDVLC